VLYSAGLRIANGLWIGGTGTAPDDDDLHIDGSINKSTALGCRVIYAGGTQTINHNTVTTLDWDTEISDTDGCWATGAYSKRLYAKHPGYYICGAAVRWNGTAATRAQALIAVLNDGSAKNLARNDLHSQQNTVGGMAVTSGMFYMDGVNDYVYFNVYQNSGGNMTIRQASTANQHECSAWLVRVA